jgi:hypothetical protein
LDFALPEVRALLESVALMGLVPTVLFCSWLAGRCFAINVPAVDYGRCEAAIFQVFALKDRLVAEGALPADLFLLQAECR